MAAIHEKIEQLNEVDKFILLLLGEKDFEPVPGQIHLQKEMYLLQNVFPQLQDETDFESYLLGPYSEIVQNEEKELERSNLIHVRDGQIRLTSEGKSVFQELVKRSDKKELEKV
ncbi:MAG: hypothetical protein QXI71_04445 [Candidatus Bathyarchaeia archaeon]